MTGKPGNVKEGLNEITEAVLNPTPRPPGAVGVSPFSRASRATAPGQLLQFSEQQKLMERELEELRRLAGAPRLLQRTKLRPSPFQTRTISDEAVKELAENLRENELATPLTVREIEPDVFEIIAGHRRDAAFGLLGRAEIPCIVVKMDDDKAERAVFFDNFFPADICDFEKYLGLKQIQTRHHYSQEQLAQRSGISRSLVTVLMSFDRLPQAALDVLAKSPMLLGGRAAANLAQLDAKYTPRIAEGLELVAAKKLNQAKLLDWIQGKEVTAPAKPTVIKSGSSVIAKMQRRQGRITVDVTSLDDAAALEKKIAEVIKEHGAAGKS